jgi:hypothetical protein
MEMDMHFNLNEEFKKTGNLFMNVTLRRVCETIVAGEKQ